jgi:hypothetical protein
MDKREMECGIAVTQKHYGRYLKLRNLDEVRIGTEPAAVVKPQEADEPADLGAGI